MRIAEAVDDRTALVAVSHVLFRSSYLLDPRPILEKARRVGAPVVLDSLSGRRHHPGGRRGARRGLRGRRLSEVALRRAWRRVSLHASRSAGVGAAAPDRLGLASAAVRLRHRRLRAGRRCAAHADGDAGDSGVLRGPARAAPAWISRRRSHQAAVGRAYAAAAGWRRSARLPLGRLARSGSAGRHRGHRTSPMPLPLPARSTLTMSSSTIVPRSASGWRLTSTTPWTRSIARSTRWPTSCDRVTTSRRRRSRQSSRNPGIHVCWRLASTQVTCCTLWPDRDCNFCEFRCPALSARASHADTNCQAVSSRRTLVKKLITREKLLIRRHLRMSSRLSFAGQVSISAIPRCLAPIHSSATCRNSLSIRELATTRALSS